MQELQEKDFDYSIVDNETAEKLKKYDKQLNRIYNNYSVEVGEVLYNVQQQLANHYEGTFSKWVDSKGINERSAYNYINAYKVLQNLQDQNQKDVFLSQPKSLQYEMSKPSANQEANQAVFNGDITTRKEYKELEKQLKQREEEKSQLESQLEQAQHSESIARKQLEDEENKEPEVVERYMEPDDYETAKEQAKKLSREKKELEQKVKFYESQRYKEESVVEKQEAKQDEPIDAREQINRDSRAVEPEVRRMMQYETSANALVSALEEIIDIHDKEIDDYEVFDKVLSTLNYKSLKQAKEKINHFIQVGGY